MVKILELPSKITHHCCAKWNVWNIASRSPYITAGCYDTLLEIDADGARSWRQTGRGVSAASSSRMLLHFNQAIDFFQR